MTLKTVDQDYSPISNVTIEYIMGETEFGLQSLEMSEEGEMFFHLPYGLLVSIEPKSQFTPEPTNPKYFVAKDGLEVVLVFDTRVSAYIFEQLLVINMGVAMEGKVITIKLLL